MPGTSLGAFEACWKVFIFKPGLNFKLYASKKCKNSIAIKNYERNLWGKVQSFKNFALKENLFQKSDDAFQSISISSVTQSCLTLCDPMDCSTPGLPVHHQLSEFTQTHVHWVSDAIQLSHPLSFPSPAPNPSQHQSAYLTSMQSTSWEMLGWKKHKLESRLPGEISITLDMQMTPPLWQKGRKWRGTKKSLDESERGEWKIWLKTQHLKNEDHGIQFHHFMTNRCGNKGNSERLYFLLLFAIKWWNRMPWSSFSECWALSQLFHSPPSLSSRDFLVPLHFLPKGGVVCISEVIDISPCNLDSSCAYFSPAFLMMYSA